MKLLLINEIKNMKNMNQSFLLIEQSKNIEIPIFWNCDFFSIVEPENEFIPP